MEKAPQKRGFAPDARFELSTGMLNFVLPKSIKIDIRSTVA